MIQNETKQQDATVVPQTPIYARVSLMAGLGLVAGLILGAWTGVLTAAIGAFVGAALGAVIGVVRVQHRRAEAQRQQRLDRDIGTIGGDIGVAPEPKRLSRPPQIPMTAASGASTSAGGGPIPRLAPSSGGPPD